MFYLLVLDCLFNLTTDQEASIFCHIDILDPKDEVKLLSKYRLCFLNFKLVVIKDGLVIRHANCLVIETFESVNHL